MRAFSDLWQEGGIRAPAFSMIPIPDLCGDNLSKPFRANEVWTLVLPEYFLFQALGGRKRRLKNTGILEINHVVLHIVVFLLD